MRSYYLFELKAFCHNKKNSAVIILLLLAALYYSLVLVPSYQPNEDINERDIRAEHDAMDYWMENREGEGISSGAQFALAYFPDLIEIDSNRIEALEEDDYEAYATWTAEWYNYQDFWIYSSPQFLSYNHIYYGEGQDYPIEEGSFWYRETAKRYEQYTESDSTLSPSILEERTALQTGYRLLNIKLVPFLLIAAVVFYANDIVTKDRRHLTIIKSFPLSLSQKLWTKTLVVLSMSSLTLFGLFIIIMLLAGLQHGFGSFSIPVPVYDGLVLEARGSFDVISLGQFYFQAAVMILLIIFLFTRLIILLSLLIRNEFFNLFAGLSLIFAERMYYMRGIGYFSNVDLLPSTFFPIGQVLSGYQNHLYNSPAITFQNGVLSLLSAIILIELLIFIASRFKAIQRFI